MPKYEFRFLAGRGAAEVVEADDADDAEDLARRRLLFTDPGFAIAVLSDGVEIVRLVQRPKTALPPLLPGGLDPAFRRHPHDQNPDGRRRLPGLARGL